MLVSNTVAELGVAGSGFSGLPGDNSENTILGVATPIHCILHGLMSHLDR